jgi:hypothetical protein
MRATVGRRMPRERRRAGEGGRSILAVRFTYLNLLNYSLVALPIHSLLNLQ